MRMILRCSRHYYLLDFLGRIFQKRDFMGIFLNICKFKGHLGNFIIFSSLTCHSDGEAVRIFCKYRKGVRGDGLQSLQLAVLLLTAFVILALAAVNVWGEVPIVCAVPNLSASQPIFFYLHHKVKQKNFVFFSLYFLLCYYSCPTLCPIYLF